MVDTGCLGACHNTADCEPLCFDPEGDYELPFHDEEFGHAFWSAVNAPTYCSSAAATSKLVRLVHRRATTDG